MRRKHIITLLLACFATLSTWAGNDLTLRPISDISQTEDNAKDRHVVPLDLSCSHPASSVTTFNGLAPTCTTPGRSGVVNFCKKCGKFYNAGFTQVLDRNDGEYISPLGHDYEDGHCKRCGETLGKYGFDINSYRPSYYGGLYTTGQNWTLCAKGEDGKLYAPGYKVLPNGKGIEAVELTPYSADNDYYYVGHQKDFAWVGFSRVQYGDSYELYNGDARLEVNWCKDVVEINGTPQTSYEFRWADKDRIELPGGTVNPGIWEYWRGEAKNDYVDIRYKDGNVLYSISLLKDGAGHYYYGLVPRMEWDPDTRPDWQKNIKHIMAGCPHEHLKLVPATDATCTKGGNLQHYVCENEECHTTFSDTDLHNQWGDFAIEPLGHNYVDGVCTHCGRPAQNYRLVTDPKQIAAGRKYILVAKVDEGKSEQYYVMGEIGGKTPYGRGAAVPVTPNPDGTIAASGEFSEIDIVEVPRGSVYNVKQEPLYYFVINGLSIRSYKGFDLGGMPIDPERDLIEQFKEQNYINGLQEFEYDKEFIQSGAVLTYINGKDWKGPQSFANIKSLEPYSAVIYPKGTFETPEHCFGFVNDGKEAFFCSWYEYNTNTQLPNVPIYLYASTDDVVAYNKAMGTFYFESEEPVTPYMIYNDVVSAQDPKNLTPITSLDLSAVELDPYFSVGELKSVLFDSKELQVSENALIVLPDSYAPGKGDKGDKKVKGDEMTNVIVAGHSNRIELADAQNLAVATDFSADEFEYTKTLTTGRWSTLVLPAAVEVPSGIEAMELTSVDLDNLTITFTPVSTLTPNVPVIVRKTAEGDEPTSFSAFGVEVKATTGQVADIEFRGTYTGLGAGEAAALGYHILAPDNAFHPAGSSATIAPFRAFLCVSESGDKGDGKDDGIKKSNLRIVFDTPTGLFTLGQQKLLQIALLPGAVTLRSEAGREVTIVDAAGRLVKHLRLAAEETTVCLPAGVYVINGTKVSVK